MRKIIAIVALLCLASVFIALPGESDASYSITYGSDSVGAEKIVFDSNGGSGGYAQYVLNGNRINFPTEYKVSGASNSAYSQISRDGYVLLGWSESKTATTPQFHPGQSYTVTSDRTFYAVWGDLTYDCIQKFGGGSDDLDCEAQHVVTTKNGSNGLIVDDETGAYLLMKASLDRGTYRYVLTVTHDGQPVSSVANSTNTSISADWLTLSISSTGSFSFSGSPDSVGVYCIEIEMLTKSLGGTYGDLEDLFCRWYVSVADPEHDASSIMHVTYDGLDVGYGPYHTAVKLPDSASQRQKGWNIVVDGSHAVFPVGGSYSVVKKETALTLSEYTFDEIAAADIVGVIAYNANGGSYNGAFAELVPIQGYQGLKSGSIVSKQGFSFLGWNSTGSASDPIYPDGYLYDIDSGYTELKAVWAESPITTFKVHLVNPGSGSQNLSFDAAAGFSYMLPVHGFEQSGYEFLGWSDTQYAPGKGQVSEGDSISTTSTKTYYAVYRPITYVFTIHYLAGAGEGTMPAQTAESETVPYCMTILGSVFSYTGYEFVGWAESKYADSPSFLEGDAYMFSDSGEVTLYAVWHELQVIPDEPEAPKHLFGLLFVGNGPSVSNIPSETYRITTSDVEAFYVPSNVPTREGYRFLGWSETSTGLATYEPGAKITLMLDGPDTSKVLRLHAVWESSQSHGGDGTNVTVTFVGESGTLRTVTVASGQSVASISAPSKEGYAFLGWFRDSAKWSFGSPVESDMVLTATYLKVFHTEIGGSTVKVLMDCNASQITVSFSDGFTGSYDSTTIPGHEVSDASGSVSVTAVTGDGTYSAVCHYSVDSQPEEEEEMDDTLLYGGIAVAIVGIIGLMVWRFVL